MAEFTFICHAPEDTRFANWLAGYLRRNGVRVQRASTSGAGAAARERETATTVSQCNNFVLVLSPAALNSWTVRDQTLVAQRNGKNIVVVSHQQCERPEILADRPRIDLTRPRWQRRSELRRLLAELNVAVEPYAKNRWAWLFELGWLPSPVWLLWLAVAVGLGAVILWQRTPSTGTVVVVPAGATPVVMSRPTLVIEPELPGAPNAQPTPVDTRVRAADGKIMLLVPQGDFLMGSSAEDAEADSDEQPQHLVFVDAFWIDKTEVTNAQYRHCVEQGGCSPSIEKRSLFVDDQHPVVGVSWAQSQAYCRWAGGRLPTEAEWEKAARGVDGRVFPWGNEFDSSRLNYCDSNCVADWRDFDGDDGYQYTAPAHAYPQGASPYGVLNMSGNVWEWTADWYAPDAYEKAVYRNPVGPATGQQRVIRGGSWLYSGRNLRVSRRQKELPTYQYENIGFRCVVPAPMQTEALDNRN